MCGTGLAAWGALGPAALPRPRRHRVQVGDCSLCFPCAACHLNMWFVCFQRQGVTCVVPASLNVQRCSPLSLQARAEKCVLPAQPVRAPYTRVCSSVQTPSFEEIDPVHKIFCDGIYSLTMGCLFGGTTNEMHRLALSSLLVQAGLLPRPPECGDDRLGLRAAPPCPVGLFLFP